MKKNLYFSIILSAMIGMSSSGHSILESIWGGATEDEAPKTQLPVPVPPTPDTNAPVNFDLGSSQQAPKPETSSGARSFDFTAPTSYFNPNPQQPSSVFPGRNSAFLSQNGSLPPPPPSMLNSCSDSSSSKGPDGENNQSLNSFQTTTSMAHSSQWGDGESSFNSYISIASDHTLTPGSGPSSLGEEDFEHVTYSEATGDGGSAQFRVQNNEEFIQELINDLNAHKTFLTHNPFTNNSDQKEWKKWSSQYLVYMCKTGVVNILELQNLIKDIQNLINHPIATTESVTPPRTFF